MRGGARTCPHGHGRMDDWLAHDHDTGEDGVERRNCSRVWKCGCRFHQMSRPFDCVVDVPPGVVALMSAEDADTYPERRIFGVPIEALRGSPARARVDSPASEHGGNWLAVLIWHACRLWSGSVPRRSALFGIVRRTARGAR